MLWPISTAKTTNLSRVRQKLSVQTTISLARKNYLEIIVFHIMEIAKRITADFTPKRITQVVLVPRVLMRKVSFTLTESGRESESDIGNRSIDSHFSVRFTTSNSK